MDTPAFVWHELGTPSVQKSRDFFTGLLGWTVREEPMGPDFTYYIWQANGKDIGGMYQTGGPGMEQVPPHWMLYVGVDDVDAAAARTTELGGTVMKEPTDIPNTGRFAIIQDPGGATIALFRPQM
jgi:uncharacterized protein